MQKGVFPRPRSVELIGGHPPAGAFVIASIPPNWRNSLAADLIPIVQKPRGEKTMPLQFIESQAANLGGDQAYELVIAPEGIVITATSENGARYALRALKQIVSDRSTIPCCRVKDSPALAHRGVQIDLGRVIERPETVKRLIELYASLNVNLLQLYFENAFVFPSLPKLARPFAWTIEQAMDVVEFAGRFGIRVIPAIQSLGHCTWVGEHPDYKEFDESFESGKVSGVLCPSHPGTLEMIEAMTRDVAPLATSGIIHLGMDESFIIGRCSRCAPRRESIGEGGIYLDHANRVAAFARAAGKRPAIWGDMFYYHPDQAAKLARDVLIFDWYYYAFDRTPHIELFNFEEIDPQALWRSHGIEAWGCPWSTCSVIMPYNQPSQSIANARSWRRYLPPGGGMMLTQWELTPVDIDLAPPIEAAMAALTWEATPSDDDDDLITRGCDHLFGRPALGRLIEQLSEYRFHGQCARRWLYADALNAMCTYALPEPDLRVASVITKIGQVIEREIRGARHESYLQVYLTSAKWLAYQYRKRATINQSTRDVSAGQFAAARERLQPLVAEARTVAELWQARWNEDRYPDDPAPLPARLRKDAALFENEIACLDAASKGDAYTGQLDRAVLLVHIKNTNPGAVIFATATSRDGQQFTDHGTAWIIEFDNRAARPTSDEELTYAFSIDRLEDACHVRITSVGNGGFSLRSVTARRGDREWGIVNVTATDRIDDPQRLMRGELLLLGRGNSRKGYEDMLAKGNASQVFTIDNGHVTLELGERIGNH